MIARTLAIAGLGGILFTGAGLLGCAHAEGDRESGRKLAGMCRTCHGLDGRARIPSAPHIGGESATYIARQLKAFRDGKRTDPMMQIVTRSLSDRQIEDLAAWYSGHAVVATVSAPQSETGPEACVACHGRDGIALTGDTPNLAGEHRLYIANQLKSYRRGSRENAIMSEIAKDLSDADIAAFASWYANTQITISLAEPAVP